MRTYAPKLFGYTSPYPLSYIVGSSGQWDVDASGRQVRIPLIYDVDSEEFGYFGDTDGRTINDCVHCKIVDAAGSPSTFLEFTLGGRTYAPSGDHYYGHVNWLIGHYKWWHQWTPNLSVNGSNKRSYITRYNWAWGAMYDHRQVRDPKTGQYNYKYFLELSLGYRLPWFAVTEEIVVKNTTPQGLRERRHIAVCSTIRFEYNKSQHAFVCRTSGPRAQQFPPIPADALPSESFDTLAELEAMIRPMFDIWANGFKHSFSGDSIKVSMSSTSGNTAAGECEADEPTSVQDIFIFNEPDLIYNKIGIIYKDGYWYNWLIQHAYLEACQSVPTLSDNSISNLLEVVGFVKALVVDHKIEFPKRLQDLWLQYRYVYKTTELDVKEAIKFAKRHMSLGNLDRALKCYGMATTTVEGCEVTCRCTLSMSPHEMGYVGKLWRALCTYGLAPDFYVVWDMIPYSFIVDWLIPVGDMLDVLDASSRFRPGEQYDFKDVCFSITYRRTVGKYTYKCYSRWAAEPLKTFNEFYWLDKPRTSDKVKLFRILDTASLLIK